MRPKGESCPGGGNLWKKRARPPGEETRWEHREEAPRLPEG